MESSDSTERYAYGTSQCLLSEKEEVKFSNIIKQYKSKWPQILDHQYRILLIWESGSFFNLISHLKFTGLKHLKLLLNTQMIWMIFIKILKNIVLIRNVKYYSFLMIWLLISVVITNNSIVTELFIRGR